jgi:molybdopterin molybdotransferase
MIRVPEALVAILSRVSALGSERIMINQALGRVLAEDIVSDVTIPPLDNSAMDGYAVRVADIAALPARLRVIGDLPAGSRSQVPVECGEALRIMTGAPVPDGADVVIKQEVTRRDGDYVEILESEPVATNIRFAGEDIKAGDTVIASGVQLSPAHIGVLASIKRASISVCQRPRVAILSTGDELVDIDGNLGDGKIVNSNSYSLAALVQQNGGTPIMLGIAHDTPEDLRACFEQGMHADIIISSGGVSVGDYDFVKDVLQDMGAEMSFWKVAMRPGRPLAFAMIGNTPVFGLPGNPVSTMISFEQFVRPAMRKMSGQQNLFRRILSAVADESVETRTGLTYFLRCRVHRETDGYHARTTGAQGSGILMSMAEANALMVVSETVGSVHKGDRVEVQILDSEFDMTENPQF